MNEEEIISLLRAGEEQGAEELLRHYTPLMRYIIAPILPDVREQEECISETAMRVWEKIGQYDPERGSWTAWLTALTRNGALNRARQGKRHTAEELTEDIPAPSPTPEEAVLRKERQEALTTALYALPERDRLIFYRKYYYRQSTAQIARETGLTERAVEGRLYRLRMRLRDSLGGERDG